MKNNKYILRRPIITEKASWMQEKSNKYVFEVDKDCNKIEIGKAVEAEFNVSVLNVHTFNTHGKVRSRGRFKGRRPDWKRAIVQLQEGDTIEFFEGA